MPELFYAEVSALDMNIDVSRLSGYRRERLRLVRNEGEYRRSLGAGLLLARAVKLSRPDIGLPLDIVCGEHGKPELRGGELYFSLSHSGELVLCALSEYRVGADIQKLSRYNESLAKRFFSEAECEALQTAEDRDAAFTRLWCLKESYLKRLGTGLHRPLSSFEAAELDGSPFIRGDKSCRLWEGSLPGYRYAVCSESADGELDVNKIELP